MPGDGSILLAVPEAPLLLLNVVRRLGRLTGVLAGGAGVLLLALWTVGHVLTDRLYVTQFLWWLPTPVVLGACFVALVAWRLLAPKLGGVGRAGRVDFTSDGAGGVGEGASRGQRLYAIALALVGVYVAFEEWRLEHLLRPMPPTGGVRVVCWNQSWEAMPPMFDRLVGLEADILMMANPHWTFDVAKYRASMGERSYAVRAGNLALFSKYPVRRSGYCSLKIMPEPNRPEFPAANAGPPDTGNALWVELDVPELGGRVILWCIDMPSDPWLDRARAFREARAAMEGFRGPVMRRLESGMDEAEPAASGAIGFPDPDIIMGDCNTPRGSWSLTLLHPGMRHAFDDAGVGPAYTYPQAAPIIAIDQMLLGPHLRAEEYRIVDMGGSRHRAQVARIRAAR